MECKQLTEGTTYLACTKCLSTRLIALGNCWGISLASLLKISLNLLSNSFQMGVCAASNTEMPILLIMFCYYTSLQICRQYQCLWELTNLENRSEKVQILQIHPHPNIFETIVGCQFLNLKKPLIIYHHVCNKVKLGIVNSDVKRSICRWYPRS